MQRQPLSSPRAFTATSPADTLGKHLRWQVLLAVGGIIVLASLLGYSTYQVTTVLAPAPGGVFREGVAGNPKYLNPLLCYGRANEVDVDLCALLYRGLTKIDNQGRVEPDLAERWEITDGKVYTFFMRPGQFWDDGRPITADDVLFTTSILQSPEVLSLTYLTVLWNTVKIEKVNEMTVRFVLSAPFTPFLSYTSVGLLPKHIYEAVSSKELATSALNNHPVGSGPLMAETIAADHIRLKPNPFYGGPTPYIPALEFRFYPDHPSLFSAFVAGEIDGVSTILPTDLPVATSRTDLQVFSVALSGYVLVEFNLDNPNVPFFQDKLVRQALYYGLNRQGLIDNVVAGEGILAHSLLLPEHWAYNPNVKNYSYNPAQAQQLLDQAGWIDSNGDSVRDKNGQPLQFVLNAVDDVTQTALIQRIAEDWAKIGVRAVPTPVTYVGLVSDLLTQRKFDAAVVKWDQLGDPDPYPLWHSSQAEGGARNYTSWRNPEADQVMEKARTILNDEERKALYWKFQEIFAEEVPGVILYHPVYSYGVSKRVHNVQIGALNEPSARFQNFASWYIVTRRLPLNQVPASIPPTPPGGSGQ